MAISSPGIPCVLLMLIATVSFFAHAVLIAHFMYAEFSGNAKP